MRLERILTHPSAFGLETASPLQRAICRLVDGAPLGELASAPGVLEAFGVTDAASLPQTTSELLILSGIRVGKSLFAAASAVHASQTVDLTGLRPGEVPRVSVLSLTLDLSHVVFAHLCGNVQAKPALRALRVGDPTSDTITLRHPSGIPIEIKCVAGAKAGASLVARWSAGCIFDEAPRMNGADDGVVNFDDAHAAVVGRLLPGARIISIGSPWAPFGPVYEMTTEHFGKPSADLVVVRAPGPVMNPVHWTPERCASLREKDPSVYATDVLAEFADPEATLLSSVSIGRCTREDPIVLPPKKGASYVATTDPATRSNAYTLAIVEITERNEAPFFRVAKVKQWLGSKLSPLSPATVLGDIANELRAYGVTRVYQDQWAADAIRDLAIRVALDVVPVTTTAQSKLASFETLKTLVSNDQVEFPPDPVLRADLLSIRKRVTQQGTSIVLPRTSDGRHADYAPAIALACSRAAADAAPLAPIGDIDAWRSEALIKNPPRWYVGARPHGRDQIGGYWDEP